ncbi:MAG: hypothetical protein M3347_06805, partial [Armatimonadota bacterium]|nr:hypothetical protein [Armatimonadota bacterium]
RTATRMAMPKKRARLRKRPRCCAWRCRLEPLQAATTNPTPPFLHRSPSSITFHRRHHAWRLQLR